MNRAACAGLLLAATLCAWPVRAGAHEATVLMLAGNGLSAADRRLIDALRIYTGDIGSRLVLSGEAPPLADAAALPRIERLAQSEEADIVVWTGRGSDGGLAFHVLAMRDREVRATDIAPLGMNRAADSVALKIRSLLSSLAAGVPPPGGAGAPLPAASEPAATNARASRSAGSSQEAPPADAGPAGPGARSAPAPRLERSPEGDEPPKPAETAISTPRVQDGEPFSPRAALRVGYDIAAPVDGTWVRQGLMLIAEARLGGTAFALQLDGVIARQSAVDLGPVTGHLRDTPIGLALVRRWSESRLALAAGPRLGLHIVDVGAAGGTDLRGTTRQISGGLGAGSLVDLTWTRYVHLWLGASAEVLLPARRFTLGGQAVAHTSPALLAVTVGLGLVIP